MYMYLYVTIIPAIICNENMAAVFSISNQKMRDDQ